MVRLVQPHTHVVGGRPVQAPLQWRKDDAVPRRVAEQRGGNVTAIPYYAWANREPGPMVGTQRKHDSTPLLDADRTDGGSIRAPPPRTSASVCGRCSWTCEGLLGAVRMRSCLSWLEDQRRRHIPPSVLTRRSTVAAERTACTLDERGSVTDLGADAASPTR